MSSNAPSTAGQAPEASRDDPLLVFVHIRKTAGKTLRQILYRQYTRGGTRLVRNYFVAPGTSLKVITEIAASPPPGLGVVHGHFLFWSEIEWPEGTQFLTLLRDPVERAISHYFWLRARNSRFRKTLEEAVTEGSIHDNLQTRVLSANMPPFGETTEEMLEAALKSLKRLTVLGLTERFDESLVLATRTLDWRRMLYRRENVTPDRKPTEEISPKAIEMIKRHNALDIELYRSATKRFEREIESQGDDFAIEVEALRRANARAANLPEGTPLDPLPSTIAGPNGSRSGDLDLRELLIEAQADLLLRDEAIERLSSISTPRRAARAQTRVRKRDSPLEQRKAALDTAIERAKTRLESARREIRAIEKEGAAQSEAAKLTALREEAATAEKRLEGFERRSGKLQGRLKASEEENGTAAEPESMPAAQEEAPTTAARPKRQRRAAAAATKASVAPERERTTKASVAPERERTTKLQGSRRFEGVPADTVWDVLDQPDRIAKLIPAVEGLEVEDESHWTAKVKLPLKSGARLLLRCEKSDQRKPEHGRLTLRGKGAGAAVTIEGVFDLRESDGATELKWQTDVALTGPVGPMGPRILQVLVRRQMKNLLNALERECARARTLASSSGETPEASQGDA